MADDLTQTILDKAAGPKRVQGDEGTVDARDLRELIEADRYVGSKNAAETKTGGMKIRKFLPPGAV